MFSRIISNQNYKFERKILVLAMPCSSLYEDENIFEDYG